MNCQIPGVRLAVSYEGRCLVPEEDGFLGELSSGTLQLDVHVAPGQLVYGIRRGGDDSYDLQKDQALNGSAGGAKLYRARVGLEANWETLEPFVPYPNNLLLLAELVTDNGCLTNRVRIWRAAIVSQKERFFLTVQLGYDTTAHRDESGRVVFPRWEKHPQLETILTRLRPGANGAILYPRAKQPGEKIKKRDCLRTDHVSEAAELPPISAYAPDPDPPATKKLRDHQAQVIRFYDARGTGTLLTPLGVARVNWRDCPERPRRRYLVDGELVRYAKLGKPKEHNPHPRFEGDKGRPARVTAFKRQAFGITLCA